MRKTDFSPEIAGGYRFHNQSRFWKNYNDFFFIKLVGGEDTIKYNKI